MTKDRNSAYKRSPGKARKPIKRRQGSERVEMLSAVCANRSPVLWLIIQVK